MPQEETCQRGFLLRVGATVCFLLRPWFRWLDLATLFLSRVALFHETLELAQVQVALWRRAFRPCHEVAHGIGQVVQVVLYERGEGLQLNVCRERRAERTLLGPEGPDDAWMCAARWSIFSPPANEGLLSSPTYTAHCRKAQLVARSRA